MPLSVCMALFRVVDRLSCLLGILSSLNCSLNTATPVVVPTTKPNVRLVCILWSSFPVGVSLISVASYHLVVVYSLVVFPSQSLQCTGPGSRFGPLLYSVSRIHPLKSYPLSWASVFLLAVLCFRLGGVSVNPVPSKLAATFLCLRSIHLTPNPSERIILSWNNFLTSKNFLSEHNFLMK